MADMMIANPDHLYEKESAEDWETLSFSHNLVQMHNTATPKRIVLKSFCTFSMGKQKIIEFLMEPGSMHKIFTNYAEIQTIPGTIVSFELPTPLGVRKRKVVVELRKSDIENQKKLSIIYADSDHQVQNSDHPVQNDDNSIKAQVFYMGFIIEEVSMFLTKFWFLCDIDPAGTLPNAVVDFMKKYLSLIPRKIKDRIKNKAE